MWCLFKKRKRGPRFKAMAKSPPERRIVWKVFAFSCILLAGLDGISHSDEFMAYQSFCNTVVIPNTSCFHLILALGLCDMFSKWQLTWGRSCLGYEDSFYTNGSNSPPRGLHFGLRQSPKLCEHFPPSSFIAQGNPLVRIRYWNWPFQTINRYPNVNVLPFCTITLLLVSYLCFRQKEVPYKRPDLK